MKKIVAWLVLLSAWMLTAGARAEVVRVYTSANFAPLMLADGRGVYPDLVAWLNRQNLGQLTFELHYIPRKRLQVKLEDGTLDGIVIGMMPEWLDDRARKKYHWTAPFDVDQFALVSLASRPVLPNTPATLRGASVGVTMGYVYPGLEHWFEHTGLQRSGGISDEKNIEKLLRGRVDCVIVSESMARYFARTHKLEHKLRIAPLAGQPTERRFLVQHRNAAVFEQLAPAVRRLHDDPAWQQALHAYQ
ncbi:MAG TPA: transporter substrate-binding domain-containing protein [Telluria sp.]|jgi:polar amino acid transport system substrate-binding protein